MEFEGTTYRPPPEADTMLLQVTVGCAHNRCTFCNMYRDVRFRTIRLEQIEEDLREARYIYRRAARIFLVNGDAFVLSADRLKTIACKIAEYFPECETISSYASIRNLKAKTDTQLRELKKHKFNDLYVGVESGSDEVLARIGKGVTVDETKRELYRLNSIGINHMANVMLGVAGQGNGLENARLSAAVMNETKPKLIWVGTMAIFKGTELYQEVTTGQFIPAPELEILEEKKELLRSLRLNGVRLLGNHPTNTIPVSGIIPTDTQKMLDRIDAGILHYGEEKLSNVFDRSTL